MDRLRGWILHLHVAALAVVIPDLSKIVPLAKLLKWFKPGRPGRLYAGMSAEKILEVVQHRLRAPWRMRGRRCLRRSLLGFYFLRLAGVPAVLNFGVYKAKGLHERAHCWITIDGRCAADPPKEPYVLILVHGTDDEAAGGHKKAAA